MFRATYRRIAAAALLFLATGAGTGAGTTPAWADGDFPAYGSIRPDKAYIRSGPSKNYPIDWVITRRGMPVILLDSYENWYKIRDIDGAEGWMHRSLISRTQRTGFIKSPEPAPLRRKEDPASRLMAYIEPGVVVRLDRCTETACETEAGAYKGWIDRKFIWGIYPGEEID